MDLFYKVGFVKKNCSVLFYRCSICSHYSGSVPTKYEKKIKKNYLIMIGQKNYLLLVFDQS